MSDHLSVLSMHIAQGEEHMAHVAIAHTREALKRASPHARPNAVVCRGTHENLADISIIATAYDYVGYERMHVWLLPSALDATRLFLAAAAIPGISAWRIGVSSQRVSAAKYRLDGFFDRRVGEKRTSAAITERTTERMRLEAYRLLSQDSYKDGTSVFIVADSTPYVRAAIEAEASIKSGPLVVSGTTEDHLGKLLFSVRPTYSTLLFLELLSGKGASIGWQFTLCRT